MAFLLDTQVWLWSLSEPERLSPATRALLEDASSELWLSVASTWEIAIKYRLGKLPLPAPPESFVPPRLLRDRIRVLPVELLHSLRVASLPLRHRDPFDRLLVAQAQLEGLVLVTADAKLHAYAVETLRA